MNRIKTLRLEFGFTQKDLASKINVSEGSISLYEKEERKPSLEILIKLARIFNCSIDYILGLSDNRRADNKTLNIIENIKKRFRILCLETEIQSNASETDIIKELGFSPYDWSTSTPPTEEQMIRLCEYFCVSRNYLIGEEFLPNGDMSAFFNDFRGDIRFPYYKDMESMSNEQIKQIIINFRNAFSINDSEDVLSDIRKTDKRNNEEHEKELEINWALSGGYNALNDENREIAKSVIESLLAKQEQEKKEKNIKNSKRNKPK